jgi:A/G-specific adenine glycosylase
MARFQDTVWEYYAAHGRHDLPWRQPAADGGFDPYMILVSEIMLQQTQVTRVWPKYVAFLEQFPDAATLARAPLGDVLVAWQGLGYNRRAKFLWQAAGMVMEQFDGRFPSSLKELIRLPGVGANTAGAVMAYAYDEPVAFVETNIRTVFIHHFFADATDVPDREVLALVTAALPSDGSARQWYWALMDYGTHIKQTVGNTSRASRSYVRQSPFQGSRRQVRGAVIRELGVRGLSREALAERVNDPRLEEVLADLESEGLVRRSSRGWQLS